jgi:glycosyltransferase involved in cell wall biosynthesis
MHLPPIRITILQGAFFPVPAVRGGAVEKLWHRLGVEFAARGHAVTQISRAVPELPREDKLEGVAHRRVPGYDQPAGGLALKWRDLLYTRRALHAAPAADILVTNTFFAPLLAPRRLGRIYVSVERMPKGQMRLYCRAARLRACSSAVRTAILDELPSAADRVSVVPNPLPATPAAPVDWSAKKNVLLYVGRLHPEKGLDLLLEAFRRAKTGGGLAGWRLEIVGPHETGRGGGGEAWWRDLRARLDHPEVDWIGSIYDPAALDACYQRARVFVYPSLAERGETFGLAPLEAMAWGCVPVVSALECFADFVHAGRNGLVFDHRASDRAERLAAALVAAAAPEARALGESALGVRSSHAPGTIAEQFLADFSAMLRNRA